MVQRERACQTIVRQHIGDATAVLCPQRRCTHSAFDNVGAPKNSTGPPITRSWKMDRLILSTSFDQRQRSSARGLTDRWLVSEQAVLQRAIFYSQFLSCFRTKGSPYLTIPIGAMSGICVSMGKGLKKSPQKLQNRRGLYPLQLEHVVPLGTRSLCGCSPCILHLLSAQYFTFFQPQFFSGRARNLL